MKKAKVLRVAFPVLVILGIAALSYRLSGQNEKETHFLTVYGNIDIRQVRLAFNATGRIKELLAREGDKVKSGQLIARLDPVRYEAGLFQARAQAEAQREVLARLVAGSRPEEIAEAGARVKAARATLTDAELTHRRIKKLAITKSTPQQNLDNAEAALKLACARLDEARQAFTLAKKGPRDEDIRAAKAQLEAYEAALKLKEQELADTSLYTSDDGVIQDRILEPGDMASAQTPVYTLALTDPVWVRAYVPEPDLGKIAPGMKAEVTTDSFPQSPYHGWIGYISPTAEFTPKQVETPDLRTRLVYQVRIYVSNPRNQLRMGMPVTVTIPLSQSKNPGPHTNESRQGG